jgi:hypothetical protein
MFEIILRTLEAFPAPDTATNAISGKGARESCFTSQQQGVVTPQQQEWGWEEKSGAPEILGMSKQPSCKRA